MTRPKQDELPGMEDKEIKPLHDAALIYAELRDRRMALNQEEAAVKAKLLGLMKKYGKESYIYDGVEVHIIHEEEWVKVRVKHEEESAEAEPDGKSFRIFFADGSESEIHAGSIKEAKAQAKRTAAMDGTTVERVEEAGQ